MVGRGACAWWGNLRSWTEREVGHGDHRLVIGTPPRRIRARTRRRHPGMRPERLLTEGPGGLGRHKRRGKANPAQQRLVPRLPRRQRIVRSRLHAARRQVWNRDRGQLREMRLRRRPVRLLGAIRAQGASGTTSPTRWSSTPTTGTNCPRRATPAPSSLPYTQLTTESSVHNAVHRRRFSRR